MEYGRDIVIRLPDASIADDDVRASLANFVTVLSLSAAAPPYAYASPKTARAVYARLLSPTHVDHLLNVLSGRLRVGGYLCAFARPSDDDSDEEEDETLVEDVFHDDVAFDDTPVASRKSSFQSTHGDDGSFHDAFLSPAKSPIVDDDSFHNAFLTPPRTKSAWSPISIMQLDHSSSVFLTPPSSLSRSTLGEGDVGGASPVPRTFRLVGAPEPPSLLDTIPIGLHPEITVLDPSPDRPENRAPRRRVAELAEIYERGAAALEADDGAGAGAPPRLHLAAPGAYEEVAAGARGAFLPLPAPYHLLPNTPYFRNAPIAPPPLKPPVPPVPAQRVINRYLNSMKVMDNLDEMEIQSLMCFNFNRTIGSCPYTMPEKAPLQLSADGDDIIDEDWSVWSYANDQRTRLTH